MSVQAENYERIKLLDLHEAIDVAFEIDQNNKVWLNIDGKCAVRIGRADNILILDNRKQV